MAVPHKCAHAGTLAFHSYATINGAAEASCVE